MCFCAYIFSCTNSVSKCLIILIYGNSKGPCHLGFPAILSSAPQPRLSSECYCTIEVYILSRGYERALKKEKFLLILFPKIQSLHSRDWVALLASLGKDHSIHTAARRDAHMSECVPCRRKVRPRKDT